MNLEERIDLDLKESMKNRQSEKTGALRMIKAAVINLKVEKRKEQLNDEDVLQVIQKQAKQRKESIESFEKAGRQDLVAKEKAELDILETYLPKQMSETEITKIIQAIIAKTGASSKNDTGRVMKEVMPLLRGKADGRLINEIVGKWLV